MSTPIPIPTDLPGCLALLPDNENGEISAEAMRAVVTCLYAALDDLAARMNMVEARCTSLEGGPS